MHNFLYLILIFSINFYATSLYADGEIPHSKKCVLVLREMKELLIKQRDDMIIENRRLNMQYDRDMRDDTYDLKNRPKTTALDHLKTWGPASGTPPTEAQRNFSRAKDRQENNQSALRYRINRLFDEIQVIKEKIVAVDKQIAAASTELSIPEKNKVPQIKESMQALSEFKKKLLAAQEEVRNVRGVVIHKMKYALSDWMGEKDALSPLLTPDTYPVDDGLFSSDPRGSEARQLRTRDLIVDERNIPFFNPVSKEYDLALPPNISRDPKAFMRFQIQQLETLKKLEPNKSGYVKTHNGIIFREKRPKEVVMKEWQEVVESEIKRLQSILENPEFDAKLAPLQKVEADVKTLNDLRAEWAKILSAIENSSQ